MKFFSTQKLDLSFILATLFLLLSAPQPSLTRTADEWRFNRTIYQLLTDRFAQTPGQENPRSCSDNSNLFDIKHYCNGTFLGIINKLDYIKNMGFNAIWISPVVKQVDTNSGGTGFHGYWAQDIYQINPHFGTASDLKNLVNAAHDKDIWVMVDVVANHMGPQDNVPIGTSQFVQIYNPFNKVEHYHDYCPYDPSGSQSNAEHCSLASLPDLNTENPYVISELNRWISWLVREFGFDGIRIDTVKHVRIDFWDAFAKSSGVFSMGEIFHDNAGVVGSYQGHIDSTLGYPLYFKLRWLYSTSNANMYQMRDAINNNRQFFKDTTILGNFIDNHDLERFNHKTQDKILVSNAITFVMLIDGIPIIYQGTEQEFRADPSGTDPHNREALWISSYSQSTSSYQLITKINAFRKVLPTSFYTSLSIEAWINEHIYAFFKDKALVITSNFGGNNPNMSLVIQGNGRYPVGDILINILNCGERITVDGSSNIPVRISGEPKVLYPEKSLKGTHICGL